MKKISITLQQFVALAALILVSSSIAQAKSSLEVTFTQGMPEKGLIVPLGRGKKQKKVTTYNKGVISLMCFYD